VADAVDQTARAITSIGKLIGEGQASPTRRPRRTNTDSRIPTNWRTDLYPMALGLVALATMNAIWCAISNLRSGQSREILQLRSNVPGERGRRFSIRTA